MHIYIYRQRERKQKEVVSYSMVYNSLPKHLEQHSVTRKTEYHVRNDSPTNEQTNDRSSREPREGHDLELVMYMYACIYIHIYIYIYTYIYI